ncbi:MAG: hydroxyethylthiazole kinase [Eubacteriales bacterium]
MLERLWSIREEVKRKGPLICNITNNVVTNFTANVLLAIGASPIMSEGELEAEELTKISDAVVLNIGTLHPRQVGYFLKAGESANRYNKPVLLDPVGVGATRYRNETALKLLEQLRVSLIRGNYGETGFLAGTACGTKGVDSLNFELDLEVTKVLANKTGALICATGATDYLSNGSTVCFNRTGHTLLQLVTGTGCALTSVMGAFLVVSEDPILGGLAALAFYGSAAEKAACSAKGPGSFALNFIDALYTLNYDEFKKITYGKIDILGDC